MTSSEKKLYILEKLKEEWELTPKKGDSTHKEHSFDYIVYYKDPRETTISSKKQFLWFADCDMDFYELKNILTIFQQEGIIYNFRFVGEYI